MRKHEYETDPAGNSAKVAGYICIGALLALIAMRFAFEQK